jgi:hypothetical protein
MLIVFYSCIVMTWIGGKWLHGEETKETKERESERVRERIGELEGPVFGFVAHIDQHTYNMIVFII